MKRKTPYNSTYKKLAIQWLNEAFPLRRDRLCFVSSSVLANSLVLRNSLLRQAANSFYNEAEVVLLDSTGASYITGQGYAIGHYARWLKKGAKRIEATSSDALVQISSFKDDAINKFTVVVINNNSVSKTVQFNFSSLDNLTGLVNGEQSYVILLVGKLSLQSHLLQHNLHIHFFQTALHLSEETIQRP